MRARVEHVFGHQQGSMDGKIVRTIGIARARFKIGMMNFGYTSAGCFSFEPVADARLGTEALPALPFMRSPTPGSGSASSIFLFAQSMSA